MPRQCFVAQRHVKVIGPKETAQRAADLNGAQCRPAAKPAAEFLHDPSHRGPDLHLVGPGPEEPFGQAGDHGAGLIRGSQRRIRRTAVLHDPRDRAQRFDVVDHRGPAVKPALRGERRPGPHDAAQPVQPVEQGRLLAGNIGPCAFGNTHFQAEAAACNVRAEMPGSSCLVQRTAEPGGGERILGAYKDDAGGCTDGEAGQDQPLEHAVRVLFHEQAVRIGTRVAFIAIGHDHAWCRVVEGGPPFGGGAEPGPAPPSQLCGFNPEQNVLWGC
ncbi:hypothetical protein D9M72_356630 [compost metagenome]